MHEASAVEAAVGLAALLIGGVGGYAVGRGLIPPGAARETAPGTAGAAAARDWATAGEGRPWASAGSAPADQAVSERDRLVAACADLADRLRDRQRALYAVLTRDLAAIGVEFEAPDGEPFDPGRHNAVGSEPAPGEEQDLLIAATTRLGYRHHDVQVRVPDVIVYRWKES
jgi:molecular chaperone GrpE